MSIIFWRSIYFDFTETHPGIISSFVSHLFFHTICWVSVQGKECQETIQFHDFMILSAHCDKLYTAVWDGDWMEIELWEAYTWNNFFLNQPYERFCQNLWLSFHGDGTEGTLHDVHNLLLLFSVYTFTLPDACDHFTEGSSVHFSLLSIHSKKCHLIKIQTYLVFLLKADVLFLESFLLGRQQTKCCLFVKLLCNIWNTILIQACIRLLEVSFIHTRSRRQINVFTTGHLQCYFNTLLIWTFLLCAALFWSYYSVSYFSFSIFIALCKSAPFICLLSIFCFKEFLFSFLVKC